MNPTKIEWCDFTWNPLTGCLHGCVYCYARKQAKRFYDFGFKPMFHPGRLYDPAMRKKPARIFVVSMGDLFGDWVPDGWIELVFEACEAAPQHTYYFLTKNPERYGYDSDDIIQLKSNYWFGVSVDNQDQYMDIASIWPFRSRSPNQFISLEPIQSEFVISGHFIPHWLIVGAETGNRKGKVIPKREWLLDIRKKCHKLGIPLFEKDSLAQLDLPGGLIQQWPDKKASEK